MLVVSARLLFFSASPCLMPIQRKAVSEPEVTHEGCIWPTDMFGLAHTELAYTIFSDDIKQSQINFTLLKKSLISFEKSETLAHTYTWHWLELSQIAPLRQGMDTPVCHRPHHSLLHSNQEPSFIENTYLALFLTPDSYSIPLSQC